MTDVGAELLDLLNIEPLEVDLFRGIGAGGETSKRIYGGQVIAQALAAAYHTVPGRLCHSLHAYFIRPGDPSIPVIYQVDRARDGGSFATRRVVAIQHGKQILNMAASFHVEEEGWDYQHEMPDVPGPEGLANREELQGRWLDQIPESMRKDFLRPRPIEIREVEPRDLIHPDPKSDINHLWFRMEAAAGASPQMQHILLAYASDMYLLGSSLRPHGLTWFSGEVMTASLDHSMWFHGPIEFKDWHLYSMDAPFTGGARGFSRGKIFTQDGRLVASTAQEGLVRPYKPK
ncbi:acyl-CoA thioesterase [Antarcticimicrobium sediminis]|uniref:Acyl-CoA thioesterase 2 n=1 Tax=Antarcticimicrobium sediminis TaxID=2546227 RepID=A0A4R5EJ54_9RHOB|nr:acyl-CoA thioesterase II [Antarcticimicrobium sediminis]TDE34549.1 acyl-CoA thioesterase II [Antarcticimicrobium sediminis]